MTQARPRLRMFAGPNGSGKSTMIKMIAGIGNIYKSETLFSVRLSPFAPVSSLSDEQLRAVVDRVLSWLVGAPT